MKRVLSIFVFFITAAVLVACSPGAQKPSTVVLPMKDSASRDTPVETLKTLTAEISAVQEQNQRIITQDKTVIGEDKGELDNFKKQVLSDVNQQMADVKSALQSTQQAEPNSSVVHQMHDEATPTSTSSTFVWVPDLQQSNEEMIGEKVTSSPKNLTSLFNENVKTNNGKDKNPFVLPQTLSLKKENPRVPYYTIPVNSTLTGAILMQPLIGRVPIDGQVPDPYTFKAIIGPENLAANGVDIPSDIQGIVASGVTEGDMLGQCARGQITAMTFVFSDGRISTTQAKENSSLGTIAAPNGNPCIAGAFHTDALLYLGATAGLAGLQGYGNALSQAQLNNTTSETGSTVSSIMGSSNTYAFGQGFSASAQAAQQWWNQRVKNSFDFVFVPNINPKTHEKLALNINITQEIPIDYDPQGRKVFYDHDTQSKTASLD